jgi:FKBP-type peptidyl-prolyl cis-trans isomerase 2
MRERLMPKANRGDTVKVHYTVRLADGTVFATSRDRAPAVFSLGAGQVIPGLEKAVLGMNQGELKSVEIPADEAYGPRRDDMILEIDRRRVPRDLQKVGQRIPLNRGGGHSIPAVVTQISEKSVVLDANHALAGKDVRFELELVEVL